MNPSSKARVEAMTEDQQQALADLELRKMRARQDLLKRARDYPGRTWWPVLLALLAFLCVFLGTGEHKAVAMILVVFAIGLVQFHANGINRRLDALMELRDAEGRDAGEEKTPDEK